MCGYLVYLTRRRQLDVTRDTTIPPKFARTFELSQGVSLISHASSFHGSVKHSSGADLRRTAISTREERARLSGTPRITRARSVVRVVHVAAPQSPRGLNTVCTSVVRKLDPMRARIRYQLIFHERALGYVPGLGKLAGLAKPSQTRLGQAGPAQGRPVLLSPDTEQSIPLLR